MKGEIRVDVVGEKKIGEGRRVCGGIKGGGVMVFEGDGLFMGVRGV